MSTSVRIRGVSKSFGAVRVLEGIDLDVGAREFVALLGPSGCGKSTLIRLVAGLDQPDRGTIALGDRVVAGEGVRVAPEARRLGMVFQSYAVWPHKTVAENVAYPLRLRRRPAGEVALAVARGLELVRLDGLSARYPHELSGGQQQRVALARALVAEPEVLLLDEPLSNLDARLREEMRQEIAELRRKVGVTVILVTHDQSEALATADRVAVMRAGRIVQLAPPEEIYRRPRDLYVARTVGAINAVPIDERAEVDGKVRVRSGPITALAEPGHPGAWLAVRPEQVRVRRDPAGPLEVRSSAFLGDRVDLRLGAGDLELQAKLEARGAPAVGERVSVELGDALVLDEGLPAPDQASDR